MMKPDKDIGEHDANDAKTAIDEILKKAAKMKIALLMIMTVGTIEEAQQIIKGMNLDMGVIDN